VTALHDNTSTYSTTPTSKCRPAYAFVLVFDVPALALGFDAPASPAAALPLALGFFAIFTSLSFEMSSSSAWSSSDGGTSSSS
jgi:hypothetical protein